MLYNRTRKMKYICTYTPEREGAWPCITDIEADLNRGVSDTSVADDVIQYVQIRSLYREEKIIQRVRYFE